MKPDRRNCDERNVLVLANRRLIGFVLSDYVSWRQTMAARTSGVPTCDDLRQEGFLGLLRAAALYDESKGASFQTYAVIWIRRYIRRALENAGVVRVPVYRQRGNGRPITATVPLDNIG